MAQKNFTITEFRKTCSRFLQTTKTKNRKFSLRKFAKEADIPASTLSKFINGKVRISENQIDTLCRVMKVSYAQTKLYGRAIRAKQPIPTINLKPDSFAVALNHPLADAFIESIDSANVTFEELQSIGVELGFSSSEAAQLIELAINHKLIIGPDSEFKYTRAPGYFSYIDTSRTKNLDSIKYQSEMLDLSKKALETVDIKKRLHTSVVLNLNLQDLEAAIHYLAEHNQDFLSLFREKRTNTTAPYALQVALVPLKDVGGKNV